MDGNQQDAHEFLVALLQKFHEELNFGGKVAVTPKESTGNVLVDAEHAWKDSIREHKSAIVDLFQVN